MIAAGVQKKAAHCRWLARKEDDVIKMQSASRRRLL